MNPILHIGFGNFILTEKIIGIFDATTTQAQKIIREHPNTLDTTRNKKCLSYLICNGNVLIKTAIRSSTLVKRLNDDSWIEVEKETPTD